MIMGFITKLFGTYSDRELKQIYPIVDKIEALEPQFQALSDQELAGKTAECGRPVSASWACAPTGCSWWAASCCIRAASLR